METKTIQLTYSPRLDNVNPLPWRETVDQEWVYVEFPYKHLLPVLEVA